MEDESNLVEVSLVGMSAGRGEFSIAHVLDIAKGIEGLGTISLGKDIIDKWEKLLEGMNQNG